LSSTDHFDLLPLHICERHGGLADTSILDKYGSGGNHDACGSTTNHCGAHMAFADRGGAILKRIHVVLLGRWHLVDSPPVHPWILVSRIQKISIQLHSLVLRELIHVLVLSD